MNKPACALTDMEQAVVCELVQGPQRSNAAIGERLFVSENTVRTHMQNVLRKTGARNRVQLAVMFFENGRELSE